MADLLDMNYINNLPQPFLARKYGDSRQWMWPVATIDVETGLMHLDVCGKLDKTHISDIAEFADADEVFHDSSDFYLESY